MSAVIIPEAANYKQLLTKFDELPDDVKSWFTIVPELITDYDYQVSISYVFTRVEIIKHVTLYKGLVKLHRTDSALTWELLAVDHMSRARFLELFKVIFAKAIPANVTAELVTAEAIRDKVAHGKDISGQQARKCLQASFDFMKLFSDFVFETASFRPFADGRGFKGRAASLPKDTSRWVLRGMGIPATKKAGAPETI